MSKELDSIILAQLEDLAQQVRGIRTKDLPQITTQVALIEDRASRSAKLIAAVISLIGVATSVVVAHFKP